MAQAQFLPRHNNTHDDSYSSLTSILRHSTEKSEKPKTWILSLMQSQQKTFATKFTIIFNNSTFISKIIFSAIFFISCLLHVEKGKYAA